MVAAYDGGFGGMVGTLRWRVLLVLIELMPDGQLPS
jgi:hypothetical protein